MFGRAGGSATCARASACAKEQIRQYVRRINRTHGKTVILTTHDMGDIEKLCNRVIVIDKGRIMYDGGLGELKRRYAADSVIAADVRGKVRSPARLKAVGAKRVEVRDGEVTITFDPARTTAAAIVGQLLRSNDVRARAPLRRPGGGGGDAGARRGAVERRHQALSEHGFVVTRPAFTAPAR